MEASERAAAAVIDEIVGRPLVHAACVEGADHGVVVTWHVSAQEQIAAVITTHMPAPEVPLAPRLVLTEAAAVFVVGVAAVLAGVIGVLLAGYATAALVGWL